MPIVYIRSGDVEAPVVVCDLCGERIADGSRGAVLGHDGLEIRFVHKGKCDKAFQASHPEYGDAWDELSDLPMFLAGNLGIDLRDLPKRAEQLRDFGLTN